MWPPPQPDPHEVRRDAAGEAPAVAAFAPEPEALPVAGEVPVEVEPEVAAPPAARAAERSAPVRRRPPPAPPAEPAPAEPVPAAVVDDPADGLDGDDEPATDGVDVPAGGLDLDDRFDETVDGDDADPEFDGEAELDEVVPGPLRGGRHRCELSRSSLGGGRDRPRAGPATAPDPPGRRPRAQESLMAGGSRRAGARAARAAPRGPLRRAGRVLWLASPVIVILAVLIGSARMAPAQTSPPTSQPPGSTTTTIPTVQSGSPAVDPLDPDDLDDARRDREAEEELVGDSAVSNPCQPTDGSAKITADGAIVPDDCWGEFPSSHYDIGCDEGAWNHVGRKVYCTFTDLTYQGARSATATALWIVEWAYAFGVYERLGGPAIAIAESYEQNMIGPLGLAELAWFYAIAWAGLQMLRGKLSLAGGELAASVVMAALAAILLANPSGYLDGAFDTMGTVSGALLSTGTGKPPPDDALDADAVLQPLQAHLHQAFVEDPYDHLNWGGSDMPTACRGMRDRIVALGPWGNSDAPRDAMEMAGCQDQADFNHDPSGQRLFGAVLTMTAALVMVVLIGLVSLTIVVAQIVAVILFAVAPFAALGAILTGGARRLALGWIAAVIRVILVVIGMSFVLSMLLLTVEALLSAGAEADLIERFALVNIVVIAMFGARRRVLHAGAEMANSIGGKLSPQAVQNNENWLAVSTVAGVSGFAIASGLNAAPGRSRAMAQNAATTRMGQRKSYNAAMVTRGSGPAPDRPGERGLRVRPPQGRGRPQDALHLDHRRPAHVAPGQGRLRAGRTPEHQGAAPPQPAQPSRPHQAADRSPQREGEEDPARPARRRQRPAWAERPARRAAAAVAGPARRAVRAAPVVRAARVAPVVRAARVAPVVPRLRWLRWFARLRRRRGRAAVRAAAGADRWRRRSRRRPPYARGGSSSLPCGAAGRSGPSGRAKTSSARGGASGWPPTASPWSSCCSCCR